MDVKDPQRSHHIKACSRAYPKTYPNYILYLSNVYVGQNSRRFLAALLKQLTCRAICGRLVNFLFRSSQSQRLFNNGQSIFHLFLQKLNLKMRQPITYFLFAACVLHAAAIIALGHQDRVITSFMETCRVRGRTDWILHVQMWSLRKTTTQIQATLVLPGSTEYPQEAVTFHLWFAATGTSSLGAIDQLHSKFWS
jgi:hypothetical protein